MNRDKSQSSTKYRLSTLLAFRICKHLRSPYLTSSFAGFGSCFYVEIIALIRRPAFGKLPTISDDLRQGTLGQ
ncbi:hypothetical protein DENSPDRAFT_520929 [Dentipellis sp. KUC8613]|nr:hypothetical protein DENSPDRAFT_520929 [Dentipellis sp. KUC8613]